MARQEFPVFEKVQTEGPWNGLEDLLKEDELPRSPKQILALAKDSSWGFGVISLVMRMNHPDKNVPPFYLSWHFAVETGRWNFAGARARNGQALNMNDVKVVLEHPEALLPEAPDVL